MTSDAMTKEGVRTRRLEEHMAVSVCASMEKRFQNPGAAEVTRLKLEDDQSLLTSVATVLQLALEFGNWSLMSARSRGHWALGIGNSH